MTTEDEALALVAQWTQAFTDADLRGVLEIFAPSATFTGTSSASYTASQEAVLMYFKRVLHERVPVSCEVLRAHVQAFGPVSVVNVLDRIQWADATLPNVSWGRTTFVLYRRDTKWQIVSFHRSEVPRATPQESERQLLEGDEQSGKDR